MYRKLSTVRTAPKHSNQRNELQDVSLQKYSIFWRLATRGEGTKWVDFVKQCKAIASKAAAFQALDTTLDAF